MITATQSAEPPMLSAGAVDIAPRLSPHQNRCTERRPVRESVRLDTAEIRRIPLAFWALSCRARFRPAWMPWAVPLDPPWAGQEDVMSAAARMVNRNLAAAAGGGLALLGSMGLSAAYAAPTPDPTPVSSVTATPSQTEPPTSPSQAPTPTPTEPTTSPSPAPSAADATPTPSPTKPPTSPGPLPSPAQATPTPGPTEHPKPSAAASQGAEGLAEPVADERFGVVVSTECGGDDGDTAVEVSLGLFSGEALTLDYVLSNDDGITRTGSVTVPTGDGGVEFEVTRLPVGAYHIDFFPDGGGEPVTVQNFEILTCLITKVECERVTFTNPVTNPSVGVFYGEGPGEQEEFTDFDLEPGESRLVRTDRGVIQWGAGTVEGGAGENFSVAGAGGGDVSVPSSCGSEPPPSEEPDDGRAGPGDGLADTGASASTVGGLVGGGLLTAAGATTLLLRRRPT